MSMLNSDQQPAVPGTFAAPAPIDPPRMPPALVPWIVAAMLAMALVLVYGRSLESPFIFDDIQCIVNNPSIMQFWPWWGETGTAPLNPPQDFITAGRPLVNFTFALNVALGRLDPTGFHAFNLLVHFLSALLLWAIVRRTLRLPFFHGRFDGAAEWLATLVALVWAIHPLQTEAVQYVSQRTEVLMGMFYLATLYASLRYFGEQQSPARAVWLTLATAMCAAGMACKEVMVSVPVVILLFDARAWRARFDRRWAPRGRSIWGWLLVGRCWRRSTSAGRGRPRRGFILTYRPMRGGSRSRR